MVLALNFNTVFSNELTALFKSGSELIEETTKDTVYIKSTSEAKETKENDPRKGSGATAICNTLLSSFRRANLVFVPDGQSSANITEISFMKTNKFRVMHLTGSLNWVCMTGWLYREFRAANNFLNSHCDTN